MMNRQITGTPLVLAEWVEERLDEFQSDEPAYRLVEIDANPSTYENAHAPGAIGFNWKTQLRDHTRRDLLSKEAFATLLGSHGITEYSSVVLYGDRSNWFAAYAYWLFTYYGHEDVHLMDGGRDYWIENDYPTTTAVPDFPHVAYTARGPFESVRGYREDIEKAIDHGIPLVDVRSPEEFRGEILAPLGRHESAQRGGHIPGALNISWDSTVTDDGMFKSHDELLDLYESRGIMDDQTVVVYGSIGEHSAIVWFTLSELLGYTNAVNYEGSWTEWGSLVGVPIETGDVN